MELNRMRSSQPKLPNGVFGQIRTLLFQPETFFKALVTSRSAWLFVAVLLMLLTGVSEVRRQERLASAAQGDISTEVMPLPSDVPVDPSGMPGGGVPLPPTDGGPSAAPATPLTPHVEQILGAGGSILALWLLLTPLLALVSLFKGRAPQISRCVQIAVWATLPLGVLALLQLAYYGAGGKAGEPGLAGLVDALPFYASLTALQQSLLLSAASKITLFHGWMLALVYLGARHTLRGRHIVVALVLALWIVLLVTLPVVTGAVKVEASLPPVNVLPDGSLPMDEPMTTPDPMSADGSLGTPDPLAMDGAVMTPDAAADSLSAESTSQASVPVIETTMPTEAPIGKPRGAK